ncbi:MAG: prepilin-type N-terminal cleavage/methylation domain-containing protein [Armatimonadetes bacterium]|nr:MAG: prepilin-type N-terminal cleavage/methylation domain-containing protein [Armatimonadota bacterium]
MKKGILKNITITQKGFTLVELLVVISIIAILSVIGVSVFSAAQGSARDGKRRSEITSIAKSIESSKDYVTQKYTYTTDNLSADFPNNSPSDARYCINITATSTTPPAVSASNYGETCPNGYSGLTGVAGPLTAQDGVDDMTDGTITAWTLCTSLERGTAYCVKSLTQ